MTRINQFRHKMNILLDKFSDLSSEVLAEELEYYTESYQQECNVQNQQPRELFKEKEEY